MFDKGISISDHFDELMELAKDRPGEFDSLRQRLINQIIESMPEERQLNVKRYQWRIDQETRRQNNSIGRCISLSSMMSARMLELAKQLDLLHRASSKQFSQRVADKKNTVIRLDKTADF
ncbi:MAG: DUF3135 domain-containing protein [Gammaproteobacteria bacterium]|nr:DUF3135 domain-containing protein [Gammaproteobacteria bacterium]NNJ91136.1 DUF3135 domain-containing protein [Gammaproteobacteria bacterium]